MEKGLFFAAKPIAHIRVGLVGLGCRGDMAKDRLPIIPGVEVAAFMVEDCNDANFSA